MYTPLPLHHDHRNRAMKFYDAKCFPERKYRVCMAGLVR